MRVFYRLSSIESSHPSPIYQGDKKRLNQFCLRSFVTAFQKIRPKMVFIADYCGREYDTILREIVPFEFEVHYTSLGINGTALKQYEMAKQGNDDIVLFQECDYVYRPSVGAQLMEAIEHFGLVSPYDHLDFYMRYDIHDEQNKIQVYNNHHYRTAKRNTMTFGMTKAIFKKQYDILIKYGYLDDEVWRVMRANGSTLWTPIPAMATHMVKDCMSPAIPWETVFNLWRT